MGLYTAINSDLKLKNATIFAQWFGVLSAAFLSAASITGAIFVGVRMRFGLYRWIGTLLSVFLFPIPVIVVELPHAFASYRTWVLTASLASWPLLYLVARAQTGHSDSVHSLVDTVGCVAVASIMGLLSNVNSVKARICFYVAFYFAMDAATQYPSALGVVSEETLWFWKTPALACCGLTLLGYALSLPFGHPFVFSRALGGSGVEPMTLLPLGAGPSRSNIAGGRIVI